MGLADSDQNVYSLQSLYNITHFVRFGVALETGTWSAGAKTPLVVPLDEPFGVILGIPFLERHRLSLTAHPEPAILADRGEGKTLASAEGKEKAAFISKVAEACAFGLVEQAQALTEKEEEMKERSGRLMEEFEDLFPSTLPPLTADYLAKTSTRHCICLVNKKRLHNQRGFAIPRKWRESWKRMLEEHLAAGRLRPSTSPYASATFIVPKKDLTVDPRWVNDYRALNSNTYWGKIDMTNAFFQTPMEEEDIAKTAIKTPWGLFEWIVMPQGLCNAPATHQARVNDALRHLIDFLGHVISREGIQADPVKTQKIKNWPQKGLTDILSLWGQKEEVAFEGIKRIVTSLPVLRAVDQDSDEPIWLMTDASKSISEALVKKTKEGYLADDFCMQVVRNLGSLLEFEHKDRLIYYEGTESSSQT
ncbi:transposase [Rhodotorula toruloides]|uniref:Transposase n=1 Tax=Rhodotorula toruloides TaxID=5286 RepID=A0A511KB75_RHOTO|nr:transposase [Rhodotorula toruloides]